MEARDAADITASDLESFYRSVRSQSERLCECLEIEDYGLQSMDDASPIKWHLAHTTWFFEVFILKVFVDTHVAINPLYEYLFNSYYNGVGEAYPRPKRGHLSRPTVADVYAYRRQVDTAMEQLIAGAPEMAIQERVELGLHHEQQHQELMLTDLKHHFAQNPLFPSYRGDVLEPKLGQVSDMTFIGHNGGIVEIGAQGGFAFDNEYPRHPVMLQPFELANRMVSNGEYLQFVQEGGYQSSPLWLSDGWAIVQAQQWRSPLYWLHQDDEWFEYRLDGLQCLDLNRPVTHLSAYEAAAYAAWAGARLPTEFEWEAVADAWQPQEASQECFLESGHFHPGSVEMVTVRQESHVEAEISGDRSSLMQGLHGQLWQWTSSSYAPYPGYRPLSGTLGEYNGKFMSSQLVLRGGSVATPRMHLRNSYRNFFYPPDRWQFSGVRLARDV
jgi:ergothioneine biosynthesis protein EgtB